MSNQYPKQFLMFLKSSLKIYFSTFQYKNFFLSCVAGVILVCAQGLTLLAQVFLSHMQEMSWTA